MFKAFRMRKIKLAIAIIAGLIIQLSTASAFSQTPEIPIAEIVRRADDQAEIYRNQFQNLISRETKFFEIFDKNGQVKKRRTVTSIFLVYQPVKSQALVEFRNVLAVDGKKIADSEKRAQNFFEEVINAQSSEKELQKLQDESSRYDLEYSVNGMTLFQAPLLADNFQPYFEYTLAGSEIIEGRDTIVLTYNQKRASPDIIIGNSAPRSEGRLTLQNEVSMTGELNPRMKGKFWLDPTTMQVRREIRQLTLQPAGFSAPVIYYETEFNYGPSEFQLLTPTRITHIQYDINKKERSSRKAGKIVFEYEKFTKPDVEVKSGEVSR